MKTLILIPNLKHKGGVTNYYRCLGLDQSPDITYMGINAFTSDRVLRSPLGGLIAAAKKAFHLPLIYLRFILAAPAYDLVHVNPSLNFKSYFRDMLFVALAVLLRRRVLVFFRGWDEDYEEKIRRSRLLSLVFKMSYANADAFVALGPLFERKLRTLGVPEGKTIFRETTIADSRHIDSLDLDEKIASYKNEVKLLFISRVLKEKGIYIAVDACARCNSASDRRVVLYIAGDGADLEGVKEYVRRKGYQNIECLGYVEGGAKRDILRDCHIMLFPTYYPEGMPNCLLEGMLYGMPIVSRPVGGIPGVVEDKVNGFVSESLECGVFADHCMRLIADAQLYEAMARANHAKANSLFTTEAVRNRLLGIYQQVVSTGPRVRRPLW